MTYDLQQPEKPTHVWIYDVNRRVYPRDPETGRAYGSPIWREHWRKHEITGETRVSFITKEGRRIPKNPERQGRDIAWSEEMIELREWQEHHRWKVVNKLQSCHLSVLLEVAELIGYEPLPPKGGASQ